MLDSMMVRLVVLAVFLVPTLWAVGVGLTWRLSDGRWPNGNEFGHDECVTHGEINKREVKECLWVFWWALALSWGAAIIWRVFATAPLKLANVTFHALTRGDFK